VRHFPLCELGYAIAVVAAVLILYGGTYLELLVRYDVTTTLHAEKETVVLEYRFGGDAASAFFLPAHQMDRLIRFDEWKGEISAEAWRELAVAMDF
jgi:hypothetical protein